MVHVQCMSLWALNTMDSPWVVLFDEGPVNSLNSAFWMPNHLITVEMVYTPSCGTVNPPSAYVIPPATFPGSFAIPTQLLAR